MGSIKDIPGVRRYVAVDGGMGDNIRPKLYGARYEVLKAAEPEAPAAGKVTIAGKYCESTDILITDIEMPPLKPGDILCLPAAGAYCLAMASNYNGMPRPAVVMVARRARARDPAPRNARGPPPGRSFLGPQGRRLRATVNAACVQLAVAQPLSSWRPVANVRGTVKT